MAFYSLNYLASLHDKGNPDIEKLDPCGLTTKENTLGHLPFHRTLFQHIISKDKGKRKT